jgi:sulfur-oxidizing protein SoxX
VPVALSVPGFAVEGDAIPASLTGQPGDPARGRSIVADRQKGLCLLCHDGPIPEQRFRGTLAPGLAGAGARLTTGQLRLRLVDGKRLNPDTIMPSYGVPSAAARVAPAFRGRSLLGPAEIEDVVAYLSTLQDPAATESP